MQEIKQHINHLLVYNNLIDKIEYLDKECFMKFKGLGNTASKFLKIYLNDYSMLHKVTALFKQGFKLDQDNYYSEPYESNVQFSEWLMIDKDISGMGWIQCPKEKYRINNYWLLDGINQVEIDYADLVSLKSHEEMAPLWSMSFDIECHSFGKFPDPQKHSVNTLAFICWIHGETDL